MTKPDRQAGIRHRRSVPLAGGQDSQQSLDWVHRQNEVTVGELQGDPSYQASFQTALDLMTAEDNIAVGAAIAGHVYNFWQDKTNALGRGAARLSPPTRPRSRRGKRSSTSTSLRRRRG